MILVLHLSVVQAITWVLISSDTFTSSLWVGVTKATLFKGLLHINTARELAVEHLMQC